MTIPPYIDLSIVMKEEDKGGDDALYALKAVVMHQGHHDGGHYYCMAYHDSQEEWYRFNDSHMNRLSEQEVLRISSGQATRDDHQESNHHHYDNHHHHHHQYTTSSSAYGSYHTSYQPMRTSSSTTTIMEGPVVLRYERVGKASIVGGGEVGGEGGQQEEEEDATKPHYGDGITTTTLMKEEKMCKSEEEEEEEAPKWQPTTTSTTTTTTTTIERVHRIIIFGEVVLRLPHDQEPTGEVVMEELMWQWHHGGMKGTLLPSMSHLILRQPHAIRSTTSTSSSGGGRYQVIVRSEDGSSTTYVIGPHTTPSQLVHAVLLQGQGQHHQHHHHSTTPSSSSSSYRLLLHGGTLPDDQPLMTNPRVVEWSIFDLSLSHLGGAPPPTTTTTTTPPTTPMECCIRYCNEDLVTMPCGTVICRDDLSIWSEENMAGDGSVRCCHHYNTSCMWSYKELMDAFQGCKEKKRAIEMRQQRLGCLSNPRVSECPTPGCYTFCTAGPGGANMTKCNSCGKVSSLS